MDFCNFCLSFFFSGSDSGTETILYDPLITSRARNSSISTEIVGNIHKGQGAVSENGSDVLYALCTLDGKEIFIIQCRWASMAQLDAPSDWRPGGHGFNPRRGRQHSFVEIDHEMFSTVILSLPLIQEGHLPVSAKECAQYWLTA